MEMFAIILVLLLVSGLNAQTGGVNVVGGNLDLSGVNTTPKIKSYTVSTLPTNTAGVLAYVTDGTSNTDCSVGGGSNKVLCVADGTNWATPTSGGSGTNPPPPASSTIGDFWVVRTSPTVLTIGQNCTTAFPCRVAFGTTTFQITASATATISAGSATAYIYISDAQVLSVGTNGDTVVCSGCTTVGSISAFPPTSIPLWNWTASSGAWTLSGGTDQRTIVQKGADPLANYVLTSSDSQLKNAVTLLPIANGGTNATTAANALINIFPTATRAGDIIYCATFAAGACSSWALLAGNNSGTQLLQESSSGVPSWVSGSAAGAGGIYPTLVVPTSSNFSWVNQLSTVVTDSTNRETFAVPTNATDPNWRLWISTASLPAHYQITAGFSINAVGAPSYYDFGIFIRDSVSGKFVFFGADSLSANGLRRINFTNVTTVSSIVNVFGVISAPTLAFFRISYDGTNRFYSYSINGWDFTTFATEAGNTTFITPDSCGMGFANTVTATTEFMAVYHWQIVSLP